MLRLGLLAMAKSQEFLQAPEASSRGFFFAAHPIFRPAPV